MLRAPVVLGQEEDGIDHVGAILLAQRLHTGVSRVDRSVVDAPGDVYDTGVQTRHHTHDSGVPRTRRVAGRDQYVDLRNRGSITFRVDIRVSERASLDKTHQYSYIRIYCMYQASYSVYECI